MLDALICLFTLVIGTPFVVAMFWRSYGLGEKWAAFTSSRAGVPAAGTNGRSRLSAAVEQDGNEWEQDGGIAVPGSLVARVQAMPEGELMGMLALLTDENGDWRYSDSRLAKFAGGRVADRMEQIRELREGVRPSEPPEPKRAIPMRHNGSERMVAIE